ncbi:MAG: lytic transglycosylase domain-containing protein [Oscillospiraceae bacterium]|jgi:soluble lytic murein transglycosylase|nr:lytic transglycosylase domain-containing protein [Oscillospiraceae bacterium]
MENTPTPYVRKPRSKRHTQVYARVGGQLPPAPRPYEDTESLPMPPARPALRRLPPLVWFVAAVLLVGLFVGAGALGINAWRAAEARRAEELRAKQWADEEARYRFGYRDLVEDYAAEQGIDPALVAAVIYNESRFDPEAESRLGARGLMQIMPETAPWIAQKLGEDEGFTFERMYDAETNIRFGTWYLGYLSKMFGGDMIKIAAGYHAGQGAVSGWLDNPAYSSDGWTLDAFPEDYASTEQYVKRVVEAHAIYVKHYYPQAAEPPQA